MTTKIAKKALSKLKRLMLTSLPFTRRAAASKSDKLSWQREGQEGEFLFHLKNTWRTSPDFMDQTRRLFSLFGFSPNEYHGRTIIDLGAGSKLRTKYFSGAKIIAVEPLAERFMKEIGWCDLSDAEIVYSSPAEERIAECVGAADLVISINVLDHCYDFDAIIGNVAAYLKNDGMAFLSFDEHTTTDEMHPLVLTEEACADTFAKNGLIVERFTKRAGEILTTYGHGEYCLNYWLRRQPSS